MNRKTYSRFCCLAVFLFLAVFFPSQAHAYSSFPVRFNFFSGVESAPDTVSPMLDPSRTYYLFVPSDCDPENITPFFDSSLTVTVDGQPITSGQLTAAFSQPGHIYGVSCGKNSYQLVLLRGSNLPSVFLTTDSGNLFTVNKSDANYEAGAAAVYQSGEELFSGRYEKLRLRGKGSKTYPKLSYNLSFFSKTSLFGMPKAKKWALIANYPDGTRIRNTLGLRLGRDSGILFTSESMLFDLYINGDYMGLYQCAENVEPGEGRVEMRDLDKANKRANLGTDISSLKAREVELDNGMLLKGFPLENNPDDITGGYILELNTSARYYESRSGFATEYHQGVTFKSPKRPSMEEVEYIALLFNEAEEALRSPTGYNSKGKHYSDYIDLESMARSYILEEFCMDMDSVLTSTFFYKPAGEDRFYAVCAWDYDHAFFPKKDATPRYGFSIGDPTRWYARNSYNLLKMLFGHAPVPTAMNLLFRTEDFRELVRSLWAEVRPAYESAIEDLSSLGTSVRSSVVMDSYLWSKAYLNYTYEGRTEAVEKELNELIADCRTRLAMLDKGFSEDAAYLYYDLNGGRGYNLSTDILTVGEETTVDRIGAAYPSLWYFNTEPDGSGTSYHFGDKIRLTEPVTVLYAMWK